MVHFKVSAVLPIPAHIFLIERDSAAFRTLVAKSLKLGKLEIEDSWMDGDVEVLKLVTNPELDKFVPKRFQNYIPMGKLVYTDLIRYDPALLQSPPYRLPVTSIPPVFSSKTKITCTLTIEEVTPESCRQTLEGDVDIKVFALGRIAESIVVDSLQKVYTAIPEVVRRWNAFRAEALKRPGGAEQLLTGRPDTAHVDWISSTVQKMLVEPYKSTELAEGGEQAESFWTASAASVSSSGELRPPPSDASGAAEQLPQAGRPTTAVRTDSNIYYDANEHFVAMDDLDSYTADIIRRDHEAAMGWYREYRAGSNGQEAIELSQDEQSPAPVKPSKSGRSVATTQSEDSTSSLADGEASAQDAAAHQARRRRHRVRRALNKTWGDWEDHWERVGVPRADVPSLPARLGHLFGLGAAWGFIKPASAASKSADALPMRPAGRPASVKTDSGGLMRISPPNPEASTMQSPFAQVAHLPLFEDEPKPAAPPKAATKPAGSKAEADTGKAEKKKEQKKGRGCFRCFGG